MYAQMFVNWTDMSEKTALVDVGIKPNFSIYFLSLGIYSISNAVLQLHIKG